MGVAVWAGGSVGEGKAVGAGETVGIVCDAAWPGAHAERIMEIRITIELTGKTLFILLIIPEFAYE